MIIQEKPSLRPVQASDYGQPAQKISNNDVNSQTPNTDGRKVLALWGCKA